MKKLIIIALCVAFNFPQIISAHDVFFSTPNEAVNFAVQNSQVHSLQHQRVLLEMRETRLGFQDFLPTFNFTLSESDSTALLAGDTRTRSFQANISQQVFDGGRRKFVYNVNRLSAMYAYLEHESSLMDFRSQIILLYYQYLMQRQMVLIKGELVATARSQLNIIEMEVAIGITLETDYLEYLISFIQIENDYNQSRRDMNMMNRRFKTAIGLSTEANLTIADNFYKEFTYLFFEPYSDFIWTVIRNNSIELKKQNLSLEYARRMLAFSRRWYVPTVSIHGGISFSGDTYPLTEPRYSLRLTIDFLNANLFPLSLSNAYGFDRRRLSSVTNSASAMVEPQPSHRVQQRLADISILENNLQRTQIERNLHEAVYDLIITHDNTLRFVDTAERTIAVMERRLEFSRREVDQGEKKRIDYLQELIALAQTRIALIEYQTQAAFYERSLEILAGFPFGVLRNEIR